MENKNDRIEIDLIKGIGIFIFVWWNKIGYR